MAELGRTIRQLVDDGLGRAAWSSTRWRPSWRCPDHVVVLDRGLVLAEGPPAEIQSDERVVAAYLGRRGMTAPLLTVSELSVHYGRINALRSP